MAPPAFAKTPDGQTPAEETVCDDYAGKAYGICNAYCEAIDCDADPHASEAACDALAIKFTEATHEESLPCDSDCYADCETQLQVALKNCSTIPEVASCEEEAHYAYSTCLDVCDAGPPPTGQECSDAGEKECGESGGTYVHNDDGTCSCESR